MMRIRSGRVRPRGRGLVLSLLDEEGLEGRGEASPLAGYSIDDLDSVLRAFESEPWVGLEIDLDGSPAAGAARAIQRIDERVPSARFALETAILDLAARRLGAPFHALLGGATPRPIPRSALVDGDSIDELLASARAATSLGAVAVKLKIGRRPWAADLDRAQALRAGIGPAVRLRLDANRTFGPAEAAGRLEALADVSPEFVEEPAAFETLLGLSDVPVTVALDESLQGPDGPERLAALAARGTVPIAVLKPTALGGLARSLSIARLAVELGSSAVATHCHEEPVARAAVAALAVVLPGPTRAAGLGAGAGLVP